MARKKGRGPGQAGSQPPRVGGGAGTSGAGGGGGGGGGGGWAPLRDSIRRDVEQAVAALAFAQRLHQKMDTQRRAFLDFPRIMEQLRSGAMERLTAALSRLYEGGQGFDLQRFLRDLPLALAQLAATDKAPAPAQAGAGTLPAQPPQPSAAPSQPPAAGSPPPASAPGAEPPGEAEDAQQAAPHPTPEPVPHPAPEPGPGPAPIPEPEPAPAAPEAGAPVSPRLELRSKLLAAAPNLAKASQSYRRNVATLRRAALPRRSPGPWRADREVLEEATRAVEFVQKLYDAYAEAWADQPLAKDLADQTAAELDRWLAWTQLDRYVELAVLASTAAPKQTRPGQHVISAPKEAASHPPPVTEASPGAVVAEQQPGPADETEEAPAAADQPVAEPEPGRA